MIAVRYFGFGLCAFSVLILIYEIIKYVERHTLNLITLRQAWQNRNVGGQTSSSGSSADSSLPGFLGDLATLLLNMPLLSVVVLLGVFLLFITRHNDRAR